MVSVTSAEKPAPLRPMRGVTSAARGVSVTGLPIGLPLSTWPIERDDIGRFAQGVRPARDSLIDGKPPHTARERESSPTLPQPRHVAPE